MLRILLPIVLLLLGLGGGIGAGLMLAPGSEAADDHASEDHQAPETDDHGPDAEASDPAEDDAHAGHGPAGTAEGPRVTPGSADHLEYVRMNNQFVVPVVHDAMVRSLVVMSLTLEVETGTNEIVFAREPRLRDGFLRVLFSHANAGGFDGNFTSAAALNPLRAGLRDAARDVLGDVVNDVLIVDIVRQDA